MSIYTPTYLYIKQHTITGKMYFGKTTKSDPEKYLGSGLHWTRHIKKHGKEHVATLWYHLFSNETELVEFATSFSIGMHIVESKQWLNLKPENGLDGGSEKGRYVSDETKSKLSAAKQGKKMPPVTDETRLKLSLAKIGSVHSIETKQKLSISHKGKTHSSESKQKISLSKLGVKHDIVTCPHCGTSGGSRNLKRYHFDNCKTITV